MLVILRGLHEFLITPRFILIVFRLAAHFNRRWIVVFIGAATDRFFRAFDAKTVRNCGAPN
jgi:hypothetical protein